MANAAGLPTLIQRLLEPARYPHLVERVELDATHGAWVLLAGDFAYKIKKPVSYPFMDFGTLAKREAACRAELRVNGRFARSEAATQLYLEVWPIVGTADDPRWGSAVADDKAFEYAVRMRRFASEQRLDQVCARGELTREHISQLAQSLVSFQAQAAVAREDDPRSDPAIGQGFVRENFHTLNRAPLSAQTLATVHRLQAHAEAQYQALWPLMQQRRAQGRVREGHGDLHLGNLVLLGEQVLPFDAIEFNDALRWVDVASDLAFLWMDLIARGQSGLANWLCSEWLDASGDADAALLWRHFANYRALVRAKVAALRADQADGDARETALDECTRYIALAERIALGSMPAPRLIITHGLSGSGKSRVARQHLLNNATEPTLRLRSDVERKRLFGLTPDARSGSGLNSGLYAADAHVRTYTHLRERAAQLIRHGWSVVVDAAFLKRAEREAFAQLAAELGCPFHMLAREAPVAVLRERIERRLAKGRDASEATVQVLEQQLQVVEPLGDDERRHLLNDPHAVD
jgi:aminoglycoside phosphotransferase family enzyme/predicted kinase